MKSRWLNYAFVNLLIVATIGVILRYKITFSLPWIDQKHLLHGHSHFAFSGWISHSLLCLLTAHLAAIKGKEIWKKYQLIIIANLITAYGMLISFPMQGYGAWSISFSTLSIVTSYLFALKYWKDLSSNSAGNISGFCFKSALIFNLLSSIGTFALAGMMITKTIHQNWYLAAVYFFLHFQYNGWFFFTLLGLFIAKIEVFQMLIPTLKLIFWSFAFACIPAYVLSALWLPMHWSIYVLVVLSAFLQFYGWIKMVVLIKKNYTIIKELFPPKTRWLFLFSGIALSIKLLLQLGSTIPSLSQLAFGFRPIVIGYLHLVLLGMVSIFLIGYLVTFHLLSISNQLLFGIKIFVTGIIINELLLMLQGVAALSYANIPFIDIGLLLAALWLFIGIMMINFSLRKVTII